MHLLRACHCLSIAEPHEPRATSIRATIERMISIRYPVDLSDLDGIASIEDDDERTAESLFIAAVEVKVAATNYRLSANERRTLADVGVDLASLAHHHVAALPV